MIIVYIILILSVILNTIFFCVLSARRDDFEDKLTKMVESTTILNKVSQDKILRQIDTISRGVQTILEKVNKPLLSESEINTMLNTIDRIRADKSKKDRLEKEGLIRQLAKENKSGQA